MARWMQRAMGELYRPDRVGLPTKYTDEGDRIGPAAWIKSFADVRLEYTPS